MIKKDFLPHFVDIEKVKEGCSDYTKSCYDENRVNLVVRVVKLFGFKRTDTLFELDSISKSLKNLETNCFILQTVPTDRLLR